MNSVSPKAFRMNVGWDEPTRLLAIAECASRLYRETRKPVSAYAINGSLGRPRRDRLQFSDCDHGMMTMEVEMKTVAAGKFKAQCLALMDEVQARKETVLITKRGKPVAKLVPVEKGTDDIYDFLTGKGSLRGDLTLPALSRDDWGDLV